MTSGSSVCIPNIGPRERRRRLIGGVVMLVIAIAVMALLWTAHVARVWRLAAFVPLLFFAINVFQVQQKTCIALAARNERNLDRGVERLDDGAELLAVKAQAKRVAARAVALAAALTALFVLAR